jgi:predicted dehydrogenase
MGRTMLEAAKDHPDVIVTRCWDTDPARGDVSVRFATNADELLLAEDVDGVYIATPPNTHAAFALAAFRAGKAVLCEKPLATSIVDGERMVEAARTTGLVNAIHFPLCDRLAVLTLEQALCRGELGRLRGVEMRLLFPEWPRPFQQHAAWLSSRSEGGYLREVLTHFLYLTQRLVGPVSLKTMSVEYGNHTASEYCAQGLFRAGDVEMTFMSHAAVAAPETYEWTLYAESASYRLLAWRELQRSIQGGPWQTVALYGEHGSERTRLTQFARAARGWPHALPDFASGLAIQRVVESCHRLVGAAAAADR